MSSGDERRKRRPLTRAQQRLVELGIQCAQDEARYAVRPAGGIPESYTYDDACSAAYVGLIDAALDFDAKIGVPFTAYCRPRARGAILDDLRRLDHASRLSRERRNTIDGARARLWSRLHRPPTDDEVRRHLRLSWPAYRRVLAHAAGQVGAPDVPIAEILHAAAAEDPAATAERDDLVERLLLRLRPRSRTVVSLYYFDGMTMLQIGELLGVTESRVSQIHGEALRSLKAKFADPPPPPDTVCT